jgi:hypothetical protein
MVSYWPQEIMITIRGYNKIGVSTFKSSSHAPAIVRRLSLGLQYLQSTTFSHDEIHPWKKGRKAQSTTRGRLAARCGYNCYLRLAHLKPWVYTLDRRMSGLGCPKAPLARHAFLPNLSALCRLSASCGLLRANPQRPSFDLVCHCFKLQSLTAFVRRMLNPPSVADWRW